MRLVKESESRVPKARGGTIVMWLLDIRVQYGIHIGGRLGRFIDTSDRYVQYVCRSINSMYMAGHPSLSRPKR
jgi:hypothetical protein